MWNGGTEVDNPSTVGASQTLIPAAPASAPAAKAGGMATLVPHLNWDGGGKGQKPFAQVTTSNGQGVQKAKGPKKGKKGKKGKGKGGEPAAQLQQAPSKNAQPAGKGSVTEGQGKASQAPPKGAVPWEDPTNDSKRQLNRERNKKSKELKKDAVAKAKATQPPPSTAAPQEPTG